MQQITRNCRKIICVGRNYAEHAIELGNSIPEQPLLFLKPPSSFLLAANDTKNPSLIKIPSNCNNLHHEVELVIVIKKTGKNISINNALDYIKGYGLGLDMTARELQNKAKKNGHPWSIAKGMDTFAPISSKLFTIDEIDYKNTTIWCKVNNELKQSGNTSQMMFTIPFLISHISSIFTLEENDCIYTGTPSGVSAVKKDDIIECGINNKSIMHFKVA